jgi:predicted adenylyl cyclase CyaB
MPGWFIDMGMNLELKARLSNLEEVKRKVEAIKIIRFEADDTQIDTFYNVPKGRLKLRESAFYGNILIPYFRADSSDAKQSDYSLIEIKDTESLKRIFSEMFGIKVVVGKMRSIYLYENVRIHLDRVKGLGDLLEFEAVLGYENSIQEGQKKIDYLRDYLNIKDADLISVAYADLLLQKMIN